MKERNLWTALGLFGAACLALGLSGAVEGGAEALLAFPFAQIGQGLRWLSLSGPVGDLAAWTMYLLLSLLPCLWLAVRVMKKRAKAEDALLGLAACLLLVVLYRMVNPAGLPAMLGSAVERTIRERELESEEIYMENSFAEILQFCQYRYVDLVEYIEMNEGPDIWDYLVGVWHVMKRSVEEGLSRTGELPGGLHIQRKAKYMHDHIVETKHPELVECQKVCSYAYAVSEQNADNGTIVTAPTCGSCGVLPAVLYYFEGKRGLSELDIAHALGVAGLFGELAKRNASVSGAECGCQAEVGVACSMAAAAACQAFGYNIHQIEYAAEVSLEHHLGLTCDPICGLVQVPCIERNAVAAMRAINSANIAYFLTGTRNISYDMVLKSMYYTGLDMNKRYRETAEGGLARIYTRRGK